MAVCRLPRRSGRHYRDRSRLDLDELPPYRTRDTAVAITDVRVHEHWSDNLFLSIDYRQGFDQHAANAPVVVRRTVDLARQCMVPMEGKAVLAHWDHASTS